MVNSHRYFPQPGPGLLDRAGVKALAAFSLVERLRLAYRGPLVTVRRSSDNATLDIGAIANTGKLNRLQLLSFCGAGNGFVTKLWDQSGSGKHITQSTTSFQPQIVSSGALLTIGTKTPVASFDGTDDRLTRSDALGLTGSPAMTIAAAALIDLTDRGSAKTSWGIGSSGVTGSQRFALYMQGTLFSQDYGGSYNLFTPGLSQAARRYVQRHALNANVDTMDVRVDGVAQTRTGGSGTGALNMLDQTLVIGGSTVTSVTEYQILKLATWIAFNSVLSGTALSTLESGLAAQCA